MPAPEALRLEELDRDQGPGGEPGQRENEDRPVGHARECHERLAGYVRIGAVVSMRTPAHPGRRALEVPLPSRWIMGFLPNEFRVSLPGDDAFIEERLNLRS